MNNKIDQNYLLWSKQYDKITSIFDADQLFTNIPLQETVDLCVQKLFEDKNYIDGLPKDSFLERLTVTITQSFDDEFDNE